MGILAVLTLVAQAVVPPPSRPVAPPPPPPPMPEFRPAPVCEAYWNAGAVFSGEVLGVKEGAPLRVANAGGLRYPRGRELAVRVERTWRGEADGDVTVRVGPELSRADFQPGEKYLFYTAPSAPHLRLFVGGRTKPLSEAAQDLDYFDRAERTPPGATITGRVVFDDGKTERPAGGYRVRLANTDSEWTAETNASGSFRFTALAAGSYGIRVDVPEETKVRGPAIITIRDPRACSEPEFRIAAVGRIEFYVLEATGKPAVRTTLELIDVDSLSGSTPKVTPAQTYADGSIGWGDVPANSRYIIGLNVTRVPDPLRPRPILFYPGVAEIASAHVFEVGPGEKVQLDTLRLPEPPARMTVTGVVVGPGGLPVRAADVLLKSAAGLSKGRPVGTRVRTDAQGRFTLPAVAGHRYFVEVSLSVDGENAQFYSASEEFVLDAKTPPLRLTRRR